MSGGESAGGAGGRTSGTWRGLLAAGAVCLGLVSSASAQEPVAVTLRANRSTVAVGQTFRVDVDVESNEGSVDSVGDLNAPGFSVEGTSRSQSMQFSFGMGQNVQTVRLTTRYTLRARAAGSQTIGPVTAYLGGRAFNSGTITVQVVPGAGGVTSLPAPTSPSLPPFGVPGPSTPPPPGVSAPTVTLGACRHGDGSPFAEGEDTDSAVSCVQVADDLFLELWLSDTRVMLGEPLRYQLRAYVDRDLVGFSAGALFSQLVRKEPAMEGFLRTNLETPDRAIEGTMAQGRSYLYATLRDKLLYPTRAGRMEIGPAEAQITLRGMLNTQEIRRRTPAFPIQVEPLPAAGRPAGFSPNNVGRALQMTVQASPGTVRAGDPFEVQLRLEGEGNLAGFKLDPPRIPGATVTKSGDKVTEPTAVSVRGRREVTWLVTSGTPGEVDLTPLLGLPYFDYGDRTYRLLRPAAAPRVSVTPGAGPGGAAVEPAPRGDERAAAPGATATASVRPWNDLGDPPSAPHRRAWFWVLALVPPCSLLGFYAGLGVLGAIRRRQGRVRPQDVLRRSQSELKRIARGRGVGDAAAQLGAVEEALLAYLEARVGEPLRGYAGPEMQRRLVAAGFPDALVVQLGTLLEGCAFGRFAPSLSRLQGAADAARGGLELLRALERIRPAAEGGRR